jgi:hypothetical protein
MTRAPLAASARAANWPMPLSEPVTITVRPDMSGIDAVEKVVIDNNVGDDYKVVNDYSRR